MRVLVTGGAGFIGSHLVDGLIEAGHEVAVVDDLTTGKAHNVNPDARMYQVNITDRDALEEVFAQVRPEVVNHHAARTSVRNSMRRPSEDASVNIMGSINLLENCIKHGTQRIIFASSCTVYSEPSYLPMDEAHPVRPQSAYGLAKHAAETYIQLFADADGLRYKLLRYGNVYGPRQDPGGEAGVVAIFTHQLLNGIQPTIFGDGAKTRDYVFVRDVVDANLLAIGDLGDNAIYNIGRGVQVSDLEIFNLVREATGVETEPVFAPKRPGEAERVSLDYSKAQKGLGWSPTVHPKDGIEKVVIQHVWDRQSNTATANPGQAIS